MVMQKKQTEGNYRIEVKANAGKGQVQKSAIFTIPKPEKTGGDSDSDYTEEININDGINIKGANYGNGWKLENGVLQITADGNYSIVGNGTATSNRVVISEGINAQVRLTDVNISTSTGSAFEIYGANVSMFLKGDNSLSSSASHRAGLEVQDSLTGHSGSIVINSSEGDGSEEGTLTAESLTCGAGIGGACQYGVTKTSVGEITINGGTINARASSGAGIGSGPSYGASAAESHVKITINGGNITATSTGSGAGIGSGGNAKKNDTNIDFITINGGTITATGSGGAAAIGGGTYSDGGKITISNSAELTLQGWIDTDNGATQPIGRGQNGTYSSDSVSFSTNVDVITLEDIPEFYNSSGVFMLSEPQTITITQGNGKTAEVKLYSQDTIEDVRKKLNNAISSELGQGVYTDNVDGFVSFVYEGNETENGFESVAGTFVIRSAVAGSAGKLSFTSDNQDLINALGLNTIQEAEDNVFSVSIFDAHTGKAIAQNISGDRNSITGILSPNMTIEFDSMANVKAHWDEKSRGYILSSEAQAYNTILHIHDRSTSFQIGQNLGEDIYINIGDMRASALGLNEIDVSTRAKASKSIALLDTAIHKVNSQRSKVGAYMNELEYNANSLTETSLHLQESESRLKDADMALEYMEFIKLQILNSTGNATLTQANQNSQNLMKIMGV